MSFGGVNVRKSGGELLIDVFLTDEDGLKITSGTVLAQLAEVQSDGSLHGYDFSDNTFKSGALTAHAAAAA